MLIKTANDLACVYISVGSNLGDVYKTVGTAIEQLESTLGITQLNTSRWYRSTAVGPGEQNDYINGVIEFHTHLAPLDVLSVLQKIESDHQRERKIRWGPRTLDLDLLLYGKQNMNTPELTIPHPRMHERNFVIIPLAELCPNLILSTGDKVEERAKKLGTQGLWLYQNTEQ